jgi:MarR family transcriptional regulator, lower aerobic nicotinate degradation pathway regulator
MKRDEVVGRPGAAGSKRVRLGIVDALVQLSFAVQGALAEIADEHDLSIVQTRLLGVLRDRSPGMNELARYLGLDKSSVTGLVDRAEKRGLVRRRPSSEDGRGIEVNVTAAGRKLALRVAIEVGRRIAELTDPLEVAEQEALSEMASRILTADARKRGVDLGAADADVDHD